MDTEHPMSVSVRPRATGAAWDDYENIRQILSAYCYIVDRAFNEGTVPDFAGLYHPDVIFTNSFEGGQQHVGLDAVTDWYRSFLGSRPRYYLWVRHKISESFITVDGNSARTSAYCDADSVDRNGVVRRMAGRYDDTFVKAGGRWLISRRYDSIHYHYSAGTASGPREWPGSLSLESHIIDDDR